MQVHLPRYIPLVVKKRHTCFFCAFGSPSKSVESAVLSAMLDVVPKKGLSHDEVS
jgi:hypothetical protein